MRYITLTQEEKIQLDYLHKASTNSVVRGRCLCLLLSDKGNSLVGVAKSLNIDGRNYDLGEKMSLSNFMITGFLSFRTWK